MAIEVTPTGEITTMECWLRTPEVCLYPEGTGPVLLYKDEKQRLWNVCKACAENAFASGEWRRSGEKMPADQFVSQYELVRDHYRQLGDVIVTSLLASLREAGIRSTTTYRVKSLDSLKNKLNRRTLTKLEAADIPDLLGIRVVTPFVDDVARIGKIISHEFAIVSTLSKSESDHRQEDVFGYSSVHYVVQLSSPRRPLHEYLLVADLQAEIQVRSTLQQAWAELAHEFQYKNQNEVPRSMQRQFGRLAALLELADQELVELHNKVSTIPNEE